MRYETHVVTSVTAAVGLTLLTNEPVAIGTILGVIVGSLLPDIDEPGSYVGRRSFGAAHIVKGIFGHRGFTHSLLAVFLVLLIPKLLSWNIEGDISHFFASNFMNGIALGYLFHIMGDFFSKSGVPLFMPFSQKKVGIPLYVTGKWSEKVILCLSVIALLAISAKKMGVW